jgi:hypothetical protein
MDYTKSTNFASKDSLSPGSALKIVRGTEIDTEFNNIATAVATKANSSDVTSSLATKADLASPALTGNPTAPTPSAGDNDTSIATTAFVTTAVAALGYPAFKNRIINGAMMIDQRNAGASVTQSTLQQYLVDRWNSFGSVTSKFSSQQNAGSVTPPVGFTNYLGNTSLSAYTIGTGEAMLIRQYIEGLNCADLAWGTANAATVTLSFLVRSSLTGTFSGTVKNNASNRSYPFTYTISSANTWEQKTVTIPGDTSGTWLTTNGIGIAIAFSLGAGASISGTANTWAGADLYGATGAVSVVGTNGATFYITGVQLEKGSTATSFDYRPYGTELALCQRYLPAWNSAAANGPFAIGQAVSTTNANVLLPFQTQPRVPPTGITATGAGSFYLVSSSNGLAGSYSSTSFAYASLTSLHISCVTSSGLVAGNATYLGTNTAPAQILATGCEL